MPNYLNKPPDIPEPFSDFVGEYNCKLRRLYCQWCKYEVISSLPGAKCGKCHEFLIESLGKRDELA